jgi:hypothetical protein|tara:strand:+ start:27231 stop:27350 length:120 start_codon:yes stop_codon:yes gene_type:complete
MEKEHRIPVEVKRFVGAMLGIILLIALAALAVDLMYGQG